MLYYRICITPAGPFSSCPCLLLSLRPEQLADSLARHPRPAPPRQLPAHPPATCILHPALSCTALRRAAAQHAQRKQQAGPAARGALPTCSCPPCVAGRGRGVPQAGGRPLWRLPGGSTWASSTPPGAGMSASPTSTVSRSRGPDSARAVTEPWLRRRGRTAQTGCLPHPALAASAAQPAAVKSMQRLQLVSSALRASPSAALPLRPAPPRPAGSARGGPGRKSLRMGASAEFYNAVLERPKADPRGYDVMFINVGAAASPAAAALWSLCVQQPCSPVAEPSEGASAPSSSSPSSPPWQPP